MQSDQKITVEAVIAKGSSAFIAEAGSYGIHTFWTIQQEISAKQTQSLRQTFQHMHKNNMRYHDFYKGFSIAGFAAVIGVFPYLKGASCALDWFGDNHVGQAMQGPCAQAFAAVIWAPATRLMELEQASIIKTAHHHPFKQLSVFNKSKKIWQDSGIRGFYRGALPLVCINSVVDALGYWLRARMELRFPENKRHQILPQLFSTFLGFSVGYAITTPFAIAETRLRIHEINPQAFPDKTFFSAMKTLCSQRSVRGLFHCAPVAALYGAISSLPVACNGIYSSPANPI